MKDVRDLLTFPQLTWCEHLDMSGRMLCAQLAGLLMLPFIYLFACLLNKHKHGLKTKLKHRNLLPSYLHKAPPKHTQKSPADRKQRRVNYLRRASPLPNAAARITFQRTSAKMHTGGKPRLSLLMCVSSFNDSSIWVRETPSYLPHPGHSYFHADNGGPPVFFSP